MTANRHYSVLKSETVDFLKKSLEGASPNTPAIFLDGTLGGAGHTEAILEAIPHSTVIACDMDASAIESARTRLQKYSDRVFFFHGNFKDLPQKLQTLPKNFQPPWNGIVLDLGYSSNQLENPEYGMSFMLTGDAPLDMRLSRPPQGETAWDILKTYEPLELTEIFKAYGELKHSKKIASQIKDALSSGKLTNSTQSLFQLISKIDPRDSMHSATLVFQALRIAVNDELRNLDTFLKNATLLLRQKGLIAVITFHSLEDRIVKHWGNEDASLFTLTKKPLLPSEHELHENSRSRSAKLRVYQRKG